MASIRSYFNIPSPPDEALAAIRQNSSHAYAQTLLPIGGIIAEFVHKTALTTAILETRNVTRLDALIYTKNIHHLVGAVRRVIEIALLYRNNLKNREYAKEVPRF